MNSRQIITTLQSVPETNLEIIRLSWEVVDTDGRLDLKKAALLEKELDIAAEEARAYISSSQQIRWALRNLLRTR